MNGDTVMMPKKLTAENGAKELLSGEFKEEITQQCLHCNGEGRDDDGEDCEYCEGNGSAQIFVTVEWSTIKEIYDLAVKNLGT